jgi:agmatine/peptidylarginine deiminase
MEGYFSTGQSPQWAVVPMEEEEEDDDDTIRLWIVTYSPQSNVTIVSHNILMHSYASIHCITVLL